MTRTCANRAGLVVDDLHASTGARMASISHSMSPLAKRRMQQDVRSSPRRRNRSRRGYERELLAQAVARYAAARLIDAPDPRGPHERCGGGAAITAARLRSGKRAAKRSAIEPPSHYCREPNRLFHSDGIEEGTDKTSWPGEHEVQAPNARSSSRGGDFDVAGTEYHQARMRSAAASSPEVGHHGEQPGFMKEDDRARRPPRPIVLEMRTAGQSHSIE